jgi:hypothetical protein
MIFELKYIIIKEAVLSGLLLYDVEPFKGRDNLGENIYNWGSVNRFYTS